MQKTNSIERKTGAARPQTATSEQNYRHVTELIFSQEGNTGSSRIPRETVNPTAISLSSGCCEKLSWTQTRKYKRSESDMLREKSKCALSNFLRNSGGRRVKYLDVDRLRSAEVCVKLLFSHFGDVGG